MNLSTWKLTTSQVEANHTVKRIIELIDYIIGTWHYYLFEITNKKGVDFFE